MWLSERARNVLYQLVLLVVIAALGWYAVSNLLFNLQSRSITIGFSYFTQEAGFDISESLIPYDPSKSYGMAFIVGLLNTLFVSCVAIVCASVIGLALGVARLSPNWLLRQVATVYIETVRNLPLLLQLLLWYGVITELFPPADQALHWGASYLSQRGLVLPWPIAHAGWWAALAGLPCALLFGWLWVRRAGARERNSGREQAIVVPLLAGLLLFPLAGWLLFGAPTEFSFPQPAGFDFEGGKTISPEFTALALGLSLYAAAFIAEIVRGGILAVDAGQSNAALALGMTRRQTLRLIVLPQAMRVIVPPLTSQYLNLTKNSSLAVAIGYPDLVSVSNTTLNQTGQAIEAMGLMMLVYLTISLLISALMNWYNGRVKLAGR
jgi:general L-amino acid transport system permease protein